MIKLIATDMDGTLLDTNGNLPSDFFDVFKKLCENNIKFVVASGRPYSTLYDQLSQIADNITFISDNGAYIIDSDGRATISIIDDDCVSKTIDICDKLDIQLIMCATKGFYAKPLTDEQAQEVTKYYPNLIYTDDLHTVDDKVFKLTILDLKGAEQNSSSALIEAFSDNYTVQVSGEYWIDIMNKGINKGNALKSLQDELNISKSETMTFGDYLNDIELLNAADFSYAVENAHPQVKEIAKYICPSNAENGVLETIKNIL